MAARRDDRFAALLEDKIVQAVGVIGPVGENLLGGQPADQAAGGRYVVLLAGPEEEADRQPQGIYDGVDFGAEPAARSPESLGLRSPLFRRPPAAWA